MRRTTPPRDDDLALLSGCLAVACAAMGALALLVASVYALARLVIG